MSVIRILRPYFATVTIGGHSNPDDNVRRQATKLPGHRFNSLLATKRSIGLLIALMLDGMKQSWLEKISHLSLILVCVVVSGAVIYDHVNNSRGKSTQFEPSSPLLGSRVPLPGVQWNTRNATVVLALSIGCHFCAESASFYRELSNVVSKNPTIGLVAVFPESEIQASTYLDREQVSVQKILSVPLSVVGVEGTPTVLLVGSDGTVRKTWVGRLAKDAEASALSDIASTAKRKSS